MVKCTVFLYEKCFKLSVNYLKPKTKSIQESSESQWISRGFQRIHLSDSTLTITLRTEASQLLRRVNVGSRVPFEAVVLCEDFFELVQARGHFLWLVTPKLNHVSAYSKASTFFTQSQLVRLVSLRNAWLVRVKHAWCAVIRVDRFGFVCKCLNSCANV